MAYLDQLLHDGLKTKSCLVMIISSSGCFNCQWPNQPDQKKRVVSLLTLAVVVVVTGSSSCNSR